MTQPWNPYAPQAPAPQNPGYGAPGTPAPQGYGPPQAPAPGYTPPQQGYPGHPNNQPPQHGYGQPGAPAPGGPTPAGYGTPQGAPPPGYGAYVPPQGHAAPPQGYGPTGGTTFRPMAPNLDSQNDPPIPPGDHIGVATGQCAIVAQGKLLTVEFQIERSQDPNLVGRKGVWKCWLVREGIRGQGGDQAASDEIGRFVVPLSGRTKETTDPGTALALVSEFVQSFKLDGQPIAGRRVGLMVRIVPPRQKKNAAPGQMTKEYTDVVLHVLPPGA